MLVFDKATAQVNPQPEQVSILVLVDVGLRRDINIPYVSEFSGFNPCFSGCWSSTTIHYCKTQHTSVSILVLVDVGLRHANISHAVSDSN